MKCIQCQTELNDNDVYCPNCGIKIQKAEIKYCSYCNNEVNINEEYCNKCGTRTISALNEPQPINNKKGIIYAIVPLICLISLFITFLFKIKSMYIIEPYIFLIGLLYIILGKTTYRKNKYIKIIFLLYVITIIIFISYILIELYTCTSRIGNVG